MWATGCVDQTATARNDSETQAAHGEITVILQIPSPILPNTFLSNLSKFIIYYLSGNKRILYLLSKRNLWAPITHFKVERN